MEESYTQRNGGGAAARDAALAMELVARLVPGADASLLVCALLAEREAPTRTVPTVPAGPELAAPERELHRVRTQLALGEAARAMQHAMNNPLTALLAEAQLLQLEPLSDEHRAAVARMVELARRVATVTRRLDGPVAARIG
jgi:signal transduction histidine kinase